MVHSALKFWVLASCLVFFTYPACANEPEGQPLRESMRIAMNGDYSQGILMVKEVKYSRPAYLVSVIRSSQSVKTLMVSEKVFYGLQDWINRLITARREIQTASSDCEMGMTITRTEGTKEKMKDDVCLRTAPNEPGKELLLSLWYESLIQKQN